MMESETSDFQTTASKDNLYLRPLMQMPLPAGCMQEFQDKAKLFFEKYSNTSVGYRIRTPQKLDAIRKHAHAKSAACIVVRDEAEFDYCARTWQYPSAYNVESLDMTECVTMVTFTCPAGESVEDEQYSGVNIPEGSIHPVISDAIDAGHFPVLLCSATRTMLFVYNFGETEHFEFQAASMAAGNWRPYRIYDRETMEQATKDYGHLDKRLPEGWGTEVTPFFEEEQT